VVRANFYRLYDDVAPLLVAAGASGWVDVIVPEGMSPKGTWREQVCSAVVDQAVWEKGGTTLDDGTRIDIALRVGPLVRVEGDDLRREAVRLLEEEGFAHVGVIAPDSGGRPSNPILIRTRSEKADRILRSIFKDLCDKKDQFSGHRAAVLCCYLPEIDSFEGLGTGSLADMTLDFFTNHAGPHIVGVSYVSNAQVVEERLPGGLAISRGAGCLNFRNPNYDEERFGRVTLPGSEPGNRVERRSA
jgi:hypothetical protein